MVVRLFAASILSFSRLKVNASNYLDHLFEPVPLLIHTY